MNIFNANKGYYYLNNKDKNQFEVYKSLTVTRYLTKKTKSKVYLTGRLVLPNKIFKKKIINKEYQLIKLDPIHVIYKKTAVWGAAYLLFLEGLQGNESKEIIPIELNEEKSCKLRRGHSKISKHSRKSNNKRYVSGKIYLPSKHIGEKILLLRLLPKIKLQYIKKDLIKKRKEKTKTTDIGAGFILFTESKDAKKRVPHKKIKYALAYKRIIHMLRSKNDINRISRKLKIKPTTVWGHICTSFNEGYIERDEFIKITLSQIREKIRDKIVELIYLERQKQTGGLNPGAFSTRAGDQVKTRINLNKIRRRVIEEIDSKAPIGMIKALSLIINSNQMKRGHESNKRTYIEGFKLDI